MAKGFTKNGSPQRDGGTGKVILLPPAAEKET